jgi:hypothetical protein
VRNKSSEKGKTGEQKKVKIYISQCGPKKIEKLKSQNPQLFRPVSCSLVFVSAFLDLRNENTLVLG